MYEILILIIICFTIYLCNKIYKFANTTYRVKTLLPSPISGKWVSCNDSIDYYDNYKLCDFFINSSYNSAFIGDLQYDYLDLNMVRNILLGGARLLEFTIMASDLSNASYPIVSNGIDEGQWSLNLNYLTFDDVCYTIQKYAFQNYMDVNGNLSNNTYPLFIYINLKVNNDLRLTNEVYKTLMKFFSTQVLNRTFDLANIPIRKLFNKIVVLSHSDFSDSQLGQIVHNNLKRVHYTDILNENKEKDTMTDYNKHNLTLVYPNLDTDTSAVNFDILPAISYGCQFIAMNYQTKDDNLKKYQLMFEKRPIVLKKSNLRDDSNTLNNAIEINEVNNKKDKINNIVGLYELYKLSAVSLAAKTDSEKTLKYNSNVNIFEFKTDSSVINNDVFKLVPGLIDNFNTISFGSLTNPERYLVASENVLQMLNNDYSDDFKMRSSFFPIRNNENGLEYYSFLTYDKQFNIIKDTGNRLVLGLGDAKYFTIKTYQTSKFQILKDYNNRPWNIVSGNFIQCLSGYPGTRFRIIKLNDTFSYIQTEDGKYVSYDGINNIILVDKPMIENTEKFEITPMYDGTQVIIRTFDNKDIYASSNGLLTVNNTSGNKMFKLLNLEVIGV